MFSELFLLRVIVNWQTFTPNFVRLVVQATPFPKGWYVSYYFILSVSASLHLSIGFINLCILLLANIIICVCHYYLAAEPVFMEIVQSLDNWTSRFIAFVFCLYTSGRASLCFTMTCLLIITIGKFAHCLTLGDPLHNDLIQKQLWSNLCWYGWVL